MKTITLKSDDAFFEKVSRLAKNFHLTKSELIRRAVNEYEAALYKQQLQEQIKEASMKVRHASTEMSKEFEATLEDGLDETR